MEWLQSQSNTWFGPTWGPVVWVTGSSLVFIVAIVLPLLLGVAYLTLWERKFIGWIQIRIGPNRVGPMGLLQPFADVLKLLMAGADVTMMCSALLRRGIDYLRTVEQDMLDWMEMHEYESVREMQGSMSHKNSANPSAFERVQYIRTLHSYKAGVP